MKANAAVELMLERIDAMVANGNVITDKTGSQASQRPAETEIGQAMVDTQAALRDLLQSVVTSLRLHRSSPLERCCVKPRWTANPWRRGSA